MIPYIINQSFLPKKGAGTHPESTFLFVITFYRGKDIIFQQFLTNELFRKVFSFKNGNTFFETENPDPIVRFVAVIQ